MDKKTLNFFLISIGGGVLGAFLVLFTFLANSDFLLSAIGFSEISFQKSGQNQKNDAFPSPLIIPDSFGLRERIVSDLSLSSVGIQVFKDGKLVNYGNGLAVSSDGLIVTIADLFVSDGLYQVFYEDKIFRGFIAAKDFKLNLLLLKTQTFYPTAINLDIDYDYQSGREILAIGKIVNLNKPAIFSQRGLLSYITDKSVILDLSVGNYLKGSGIFDMKSRFLGLIYLRNGKHNLVKTSVIKSFLDNYIN